MYNMHIRNALQVSRNLHILIDRETLTHILIDTGQNETTPTIPL